MVPTIETATVVSFRLKVPLVELERVAGDQGYQDLKLSLAHEGNERVLSGVDADSQLRFRPIGEHAILTEIVLAKDPSGAFFERVLGGLMVRHLGDLRVRLCWSVPERNLHGAFEEVRISRGATDYPGLARNVVVGTMQNLPSGEGQAPQQQLSTEQPARPADLTQEEREILDLLDKARKHWAEYQRLKAAKSR